MGLVDVKTSSPCRSGYVSKFKVYKLVNEVLLFCASWDFSTQNLRNHDGYQIHFNETEGSMTRVTFCCTSRLTKKL